jgi:hypothetical protein
MGRFLPLILRTVAVIVCMGAAMAALFLRTRESDLQPCSLATEFLPCGHQTDYRIGLRVAIIVMGIGVSLVLFLLARRVERQRGATHRRRDAARIT